MDRAKGIAYCGLACCLCSEDCPGCRYDGCSGREWCKSLKCCKQMSYDGCWECGDFPCDNPMLSKLRIRVFAKFAKEYGKEMLMQALEKNEADGMVYHYHGQLTGDYDVPETEEGIKKLILKGL